VFLNSATESGKKTFDVSAESVFEESEGQSVERLLPEKITCGSFSHGER
jgi:hypothetical protein